MSVIILVHCVLEQ